MTATTRILVNGREQSMLPVIDRGLQYGDGVFRTALVRDSRPVYFDHHVRHLAAACARLGLASPDWDAMAQRAAEFCSDTREGVLKVILTRGAGGGGYRPLAGETTEIMQLHAPLPSHPPANWRQGVAVRICNARLSINPMLAGIKHLNRLEQVLARGEWDDPAVAEGLMLDTAGHVIEATACNLFLVRDSVLYTPDLGGSGVAGVMRGMILDAAPKYTKAVTIKTVTLEDCMAADELFLTNAVIGIWPIQRLRNNRWDVGEITRKLQDHFPDVRR